ncbi:MAG: tripartite tricarboxylate transporter substrate binding protein [Hyphomicrobiales bacterium]|nr:tripartite tricarboxylate transporter substrate binding protein [Hyphomicrobiales bacterium]
MAHVHRLLLGCLLLITAAPAEAQTWPSRPVKLIVPTGPGAATDVMARLLADAIARPLGQPVVVENLAGASGIVAHQTVARAAPDGYTLLFTNTSGIAVNPVSYKQLPYDPSRDFTAVATVCSLGPQMVSVNAELPVKTLPELIAYARDQRGKLSIAFDTTAGAAAFAARLLNRRGDLGFTEVPYRAAAQMAQDVASGVVQVMMSSVAAASAVVQAGKVRRIAITSEKRFPGLPELPSVSETLPGVVMNGWFAVVAPTGTPADIIARLNREIGIFLQAAEVQQRLLGFGLATEGAGTPESTASFIRGEQERWRALAKELPIEPQ